MPGPTALLAGQATTPLIYPGDDLGTHLPFSNFITDIVPHDISAPAPPPPPVGSPIVPQPTTGMLMLASIGATGAPETSRDLLRSNLVVFAVTTIVLFLLVRVLK